MALTLPNETLKSGKAVLPFKIFKKLSLLYYVLVKHGCYYKRFYIFLKAFVIVSAVSLAVTRKVHRSNVGYSNAKYHNLQHDYVDCCFGIKLLIFTHKNTSKKKDNSHIFNMVTKKVICVVFWLRNTYLKILELFCS